MSTYQKGSKYKSKTKKWLEGHGFQVISLEQYSSTWTPKGLFYQKKDWMASDLLAISPSNLIFVQVKYGTHNVADAKHKFDDLKFPPFCKQWIVAWIPFDRESLYIYAKENNIWIQNKIPKSLQGTNDSLKALLR